MTRKPNDFYQDDPVITALAVGFVVGWAIIIVYAVRWVMEVAR